MSFRVRTIYVSHAGLPSGLATDGALRDYICDVDRELAALQEDWDAYRRSQQAGAQDTDHFEQAIDRLSELKADATRKLASATDDPA